MPPFLDVHPAAQARGRELFLMLLLRSMPLFLYDSHEGLIKWRHWNSG
jgi:hypothetical protein